MLTSLTSLALCSEELLACQVEEGIMSNCDLAAFDKFAQDANAPNFWGSDKSAGRNIELLERLLTGR